MIREIIAGVLVVMGLTSGAETTQPSQLPELRRVWNFDDPESTEKKFRSLLALAKQAGDHGYELQVMTQIARTYSLRDKFDEAHNTLDPVEQALKTESLGSATAIVRTRYLLERGRTFNSANRKAAAVPLFQQAADDAREGMLTSLEVDAIHMMAIAAPEAKDRIDFGEHGIARAKELKEIGWIPPLSNNLGEEYRSLKQYDKALACFRGILEAQKQMGQPPDLYAQVDEAKMLRLLGHPDESLEKMRALEAELRKKNESDGFVAEELAEALLALKKPDAAKTYFVTAYEKLKGEQWLKDSEPQRLERLKTLSESH